MGIVKYHHNGTKLRRCLSRGWVLAQGVQQSNVLRARPRYLRSLRSRHLGGLPSDTRDGLSRGTVHPGGVRSVQWSFHNIQSLEQGEQLARALE